jgi:ABC-type Fe3+/spermidine/putrescine transport system ATPase subunit
LIEGRVVELGGDSKPGRLETKKGTLCFVPTTQLEKNQTAVISIRPEHIQVHKTQPQGLDNVVEGTVKEAVFMGDAYHCQVTVGEDLLRVHTHPFLAMSPGEKVFLHLDPQSCNGLPAEDIEGMDESMLGA